MFLGLGWVCYLFMECIYIYVYCELAYLEYGWMVSTYRGLQYFHTFYILWIFSDRIELPVWNLLLSFGL